jgi:hypothetical protein
MGADISCMRTAKGWLCLAVVPDLLSRPLPWSLEPVALPWLDPSFRPRVAVLLGRRSGAASQTRHPELDQRAQEEKVILHAEYWEPHLNGLREIILPLAAFIADNWSRRCDPEELDEAAVPSFD